MRDHPPTRQRLWLLILVLGLIVVGAIALVSLLAARLSPTRASVPAEVARHWLAGIPCAPPCWEGITPGQTTLPEALRILKANPAIDPTSVLTDEYPLV